MHLSPFHFSLVMERILFAIDLNEPPTVTRAVEVFARRLGAEMFALHVMTPPEAVPFSGYEGLIGLEGLPYSLYDPTLEREREEAETDAFNRFLKERFEGAVHAAVRQGDPAAVILDDAAQHRADLIVLGHRHRGFVEKLFTGSVASAVLKESTVPVLLFPIFEA